MTLFGQEDDFNEPEGTRYSAHTAHSQHAEDGGSVVKTCRYFGFERASFYRWKALYKKEGVEGLVNKKPIPKNPIKRTPADVVEKVLYLRQTYPLRPIQIVWYLARYHDIKISGAGV